MICEYSGGFGVWLPGSNPSSNISLLAYHLASPRLSCFISTVGWELIIIVPVSEDCLRIK